MIHRNSLILSLALICFASLSHAGEKRAHNPYADLTDRDVTGLTNDEINGYVSGDPMSMPRVAEWNEYPSPKAVLKHSDHLELSHMQLAKAQQIYDRTLKQAMLQGKRIILAELRLDSLAESGDMTEKSMAEFVHEIAKLKAELRILHISAHIEMRDLLSDEQLERYRRKQGYASN